MLPGSLFAKSVALQSYRGLGILLVLDDLLHGGLHLDLHSVVPF